MLKLDLSISCLQEMYLTGKEEYIALEWEEWKISQANVVRKQAGIEIPTSSVIHSKLRLVKWNEESQLYNFIHIHIYIYVFIYMHWTPLYLKVEMAPAQEQWVTITPDSHG